MAIKTVLLIFEKEKGMVMVVGIKLPFLLNQPFFNIVKTFGSGQVLP